MKTITPCLWFESQAEEAAEFYVSLFPGSKIQTVTHYEKAGAEASGQPEGSVMTVSFHLMGQNFLALNGGPGFPFSLAISFMANCDTQEEIDRLWNKLTDAGEPGQCGWLKDRFGVSWQIVPAEMDEMLRTATPAAIQRVMAVLMKMTKLDAGELKHAYEGR